MQDETVTNRRPSPHTWMAILASIALFFLVLVVVLPLGMAYGLQSWLQTHGGDEVQLEDIDFNLFNGKVVITNLIVQSSGEQRLVIPRVAVDVDWLPLFSQQVVVRSIMIDGVDITIHQAEDGTLVLGGIRLPEPADTDNELADEPWGFGLQAMEVANVSIEYQSPALQLQVHLNNLRLSQLATWATDPARLVLDGTLNGAQVTLDGQLPPLSTGFGYTGTLAISALPLKTFAELAQPAVAGLDGTLTLDTRLDVLQAEGKPLSVSQAGEIVVAGLALEKGGQKLTYAHLQWEGTTAVSSLPDESQINLQGELTGADLTVAIPAEPLHVTQGGFLWDGELLVDSGAATSVQASGHLVVKQLGVGIDDRKISLVNIGEINAGQLSLLKDGDLTVTDLKLTDAVFARDAEEGEGKVGKGDAVLSAAAITVDSFQVTDGNQVSIGVMEWRDVTSHIRRNPAGDWHVVRIIDTLPFTGKDKVDESSAGEAVAVDDAQAGQVRVGELKITGDSAIVLDDATVKPPVNLNVRITEAYLKNMDSGQPEQDSPILVKGRIGRHSSIAIKGTMQPFAASLALNLSSQIDGVSLTQLSPYTVSSLGYALESGQLDTKSTLKISKGKIDSENTLVIHGLEVKPADNDSREKLDSQLAVPLETALNMLRDDHDTIKLDLPVSGDLDSPEFDISDVVNTAVSKALKKGTMTYLTLALQPYGALITVAKLAGDAASKVRLQPVGFEPGSVTTLADTDDYLEKVATILKDRPEVHIKICGLAVAGDRMALAGEVSAEKAVGAEVESDKSGKGTELITDEQLLALAQQRARFVKDHLVIKFGVTASRLVACQPHIDEGGDEQAPRVDLLI